MMRTVDTPDEVGPLCPLCGKPARITGRWAAARISCGYCGGEVLAARHRDAIEAYKQGLCDGIDPAPEPW